MSAMPFDPEFAVGTRIDGYRISTPLREGSIGYVSTVEAELPQGKGREQGGKRHRLPQAQSHFLRIFRPDEDSQQATLYLDRISSVEHENVLSYEVAARATSGIFRGAFYCVRQDLGKRTRPLSLKRPLDADQMLLIGRELSAGLAYLHRNNILHGDLKPANVARAGGEWKLVDFGLQPMVARNQCIRPRFANHSIHAASEVFEANSSGQPGDVFGLAATLVAIFLDRPDLTDPVQGIEDLRHSAGSGGHSLEWIELLEACLHPDPETRPTAGAISAYLANGSSRIALWEEPARQLSNHVFITRLRGGIARTLRVSADAAEELSAEAITRLLNRIQKDSMLAARLSGPEALLKYLIVTARNVAMDAYRKSAGLHLLSPSQMGYLATMPEEPSDEMDPILAIERTGEALLNVEREVGPVATRLLWLRMHNRSYEAIREDLASYGIMWSDARVFMALFRLRRAYPELAGVLPLDAKEDSTPYLEHWLADLGLSDREDRYLVAATLAGVSAKEAAAVIGISSDAARQRLRRLSRSDRWLSLLIDARSPIPERYEDVASHLGSWLNAPSTASLTQPWLDSVRKSADALLADITEHGRPTQAETDNAVDAILRDIRIASDLQSKILSNKMIDEGELGDILGLQPEEARSWLMQMQEADALIVLSDGQDTLIPAFQFDDDGLIAAVGRVNKILEASRDPWGATGWWTQPNGRLPNSSCPVDILAKNTRVLIELAQAMVTDD